LYSVYAVAFSPDGSKRLDSRTGTVNVFAPDGKRAVSSGWDGQINLVDLVTGNKLASVRADSGAVEALALSPDGQILATAGEDKRIKLWRVDLNK
jgi:WD40 repeat protein